MRMSRERIFHLADLIVKELGALPGIQVKAPDDVRPEIVRILTEESKLDDSIDVEVRKTLGSYARPAPEGSREWEILYQKTRDEVLRRRFRTLIGWWSGSAGPPVSSTASACCRSSATLPTSRRTS